MEPLPVLFAKAWQNCEYSTRGGVLPRNYLPITAAIARSPCQLPSPPSLLSLVPPPHLSSISRRMRQDQGGGCEASAGATCNARAELSVFGKGGGCCKKLSACHIRHCSLSVPPPPPLFVNLASDAAGSVWRILELLLVLFATAWQNCEYSTRVGSAAAKLSAYHTCCCLLTPSSPLPPSLLSLVPRVRLKEEDTEPLLMLFCNAFLKL